MGIKITIGELSKRLEKKMKAMKAAALIAVTNAAEQGVALSIHATSTKPKPGGRGVGVVDRGLFKASWHYRKLPTGAELYNDAPYAAPIEVGSRPHWMPFAPLLAWVKRKQGDLGITDEDVGRVAKAIQRKIAKVGTKPMFIAKDLLPDLTRELKGEFERQLAVIARQK